MAANLKANGYDKLSSVEAHNILLKFPTNSNADLKGTLFYIVNTFNGKISASINTFSWNSNQIEPMALDIMKTVYRALQNLGRSFMK